MKRAKLIWRGVGPIKANTALDNVPKKPGVYKLTFHLWGKTYAFGAIGALCDVLADSRVQELVPDDTVRTPIPPSATV